MKIVQMGIALFVAVTLTGQASAQKIIWTNKAPATGTSILVKPTIYLSGQVQNIAVQRVSVYIWVSGTAFPKKANYTPAVNQTTGNFGNADYMVPLGETEYAIIIDAFDGTNTYRLSGFATSSKK